MKLGKQAAHICDRVTGGPISGADFEIRYQVDGEEHVRAGVTSLGGDALILQLPEVKNALVIASRFDYAMRTAVMDLPLGRELRIGLDTFEMPEADTAADASEPDVSDVGETRGNVIELLIQAVRWGYSATKRPKGMTADDWTEHLTRVRKICKLAHDQAETEFPEAMQQLPRGGIDALIHM